MRIVINGVPIEVTGQQGPVGSQGPDGNPLGTIISFMGKAAPDGYLVCDGSEYNMADYPELSRFFREQFGAENHFGGDGTITFAVPHLCADANCGIYSTEEHIVGQWIDGKPIYRKVISGIVSSGLILLTSVSQVISIDGILYGGNLVDHYPVFYYADASNMLAYSLNNGNLTVYPSANNIGTKFNAIIEYTKITDETVEPGTLILDTSVACKICIKAVKSIPAQDIYSLEERVVGRWLDGKPIYQRSFVHNVTVDTSTRVLADITELNVDTIILMEGMLSSDAQVRPINSQLSVLYTNANKTMLYGYSETAYTLLHSTLQYTKTTDSPTEVT